MPSRITILPASTQAGTQTIRALLESENKPFIRGIYRNPAKAPAEFTKHANFEAVQGDVTAGANLNFAASDAVLYVPPPTWDGADDISYAHQTADGVAEALRRSPGVKRLVIQSAMGAHHDIDEIGTLSLNHITDKTLKDVVPEVVIVRPGYYYQIWTEALKTMREDPPRFESPFSPADFAIPMVSTKDVGKYLAKTLLADTIDDRKRDVRLFGPQHYSPLDVKRALETVTGREGELVVIPREGLTEFWRKSIPEAHLAEFVRFITAMLPGGAIAQDYQDGDDSVRNETALVDELREMLGEGI